MHHSSESVDWLSTLRVHPVSQTIDTALVAACLLFIGFPLKAVMAANAVIGFSGVLTHANVSWTFGRFGRLFVSPVFHHWHHALKDNSAVQHEINFGAALSVWDRIFRTSVETETGPTQYGTNDAPAADLWNLFIHPVRVVFRYIKQRR
jgi:sterol desaturase/sphingolipid hydroxylase (fatty acid hydroxylase superfamily)